MFVELTEVGTVKGNTHQIITSVDSIENETNKNYIWVLENVT